MNDDEQRIREKQRISARRWQVTKELVPGLSFNWEIATDFDSPHRWRCDCHPSQTWNRWFDLADFHEVPIPAPRRVERQPPKAV